MNSNVYLGLSGIALPTPRYKLSEEFQSMSRLAIYATYFNSVEINASFYKIPRPQTVTRWASGVPDHFRFTFKLHQDFTHQKDLTKRVTDLGPFQVSIAGASVKAGCILIQFPPSVKSGNIHQLEDLLIRWKESDSIVWHLAVEFRDSGWYNEETFELLQAYEVSLVLHDMPRSASPFVTTSNKHVYVRFHGPEGTYRGSYSSEFLQEYAEYITGWMSEQKTVYVYFNNTAGDAFNNALTLQRCLNDIIGK